MDRFLSEYLINNSGLIIFREEDAVSRNTPNIGLAVLRIYTYHNSVSNDAVNYL
jgi:hypothetical protein